MSRYLLLGGLAIVLAAGCDKSEEGARPVPLEEGGQASAAEGAPREPSAEAPPGADAEEEAEAPVAAPAPSATAAELKVGVAREVLVQTLGDCGERVKFLEPRSYRRSLEVFQPKPGECVERFGKRHFVVVGEAVAQVSDGLRPKLDPASARVAEESDGLPR